jgi:hypothetical protein
MLFPSSCFISRATDAFSIIVNFDCESLIVIVFRVSDTTIPSIPLCVEFEE